MRLALSFVVLSGTAGLAAAAEPAPPPRELREREVLKRLEGDWVLQSVLVAAPDGLRWGELDAPGTPKMAFTFKDGYQIMTKDGKPVSDKHPQLKLGPEPECLLVCGPPDKKPFRVRYRIEGDILTYVQDLSFQEECPESFDALRGRDRGRRILTFTRASADPPASKEQQERDVLKRLEGDWVLKTGLTASHDGLRLTDFTGPNASKVVSTIKDGVQDIAVDGKPAPDMWWTLKLGAEAECLVLVGRPGQKVHKNRFRLDGDTLVIVQDLAFPEECPDSFDAAKGRDRGRTLSTFIREPRKP